MPKEYGERARERMKEMRSQGGILGFGILGNRKGDEYGQRIREAEQRTRQRVEHEREEAKERRARVEERYEETRARGKEIESRVKGRRGGILGFGIIGSFGLLDRGRKQERTVPMPELPDCDICKQKGTKREAHWDCKTEMGPWAYLCEFHKDLVAVGPCTKLEKQVKVAAAKSDKVPTVQTPMGCDDVCEVKCPHCGEPRTVEPDANYVVECDSCGNSYKVVSWL